MINVRSVADLNRAIAKNLYRLDRRKFDLIVGIPRSGMIPAPIIATALQLPLSDLELFRRGFMYGRSGRVHPVPPNPRILLVDDTSNRGGAMAAAVARIKGRAAEVTRFAVYGPYRDDLSIIDIFLEECPGPRAFQWNMWKHARLPRWCFDLDGVFCRDPSREENDDGPRYREFILNAEPMFLPVRPIGHIMTCRLEKFRGETEHWLKLHGISFTSLTMMQYKTKAERMEAGGRGQWKAERMLELHEQGHKVELFIESSHKQAKIIAARTGFPVWCIETQECIYAQRSS